MQTGFGRCARRMCRDFRTFSDRLCAGYIVQGKLADAAAKAVELVPAGALAFGFGDSTAFVILRAFALLADACK